MALFSKEPDKNVRTDANSRVLPPAQPMTPVVVTSSPGPSEKPIMPMPKASAPAAEARVHLPVGAGRRGLHSELRWETTSSQYDQQVIAGIVSLNKLDSGQVQPGQRLAIPTQYSSNH